MLVFSCPKCLNNDLRSSLEKSGKTDSLECTSCGTNYPIINEIPRLTDLTLNLLDINGIFLESHSLIVT